jgi:hypothetical protein
MGGRRSDPGVLSVNVSGVEFARGRIQETARQTLEASRLSAQFLELEITESAIMSHAEDSAQVLDNLRAMGLSLVIDDFGTGYSSLAYLKRLPLNKLKVDQSFVRGLPGDTEDCAIVRAVIALAHSLQLTVIAEGVENEAQREFLAREGCDEMQGYLRGRPMPFDEYAMRFLHAEAPPTGATSRLAFVDALKALACQLIVLHHLAFYGPMSDHAYSLAPALISWLSQDARMAVQAFLVIGGFLAVRAIARTAPCCRASRSCSC